LSSQLWFTLKVRTIFQGVQEKLAQERASGISGREEEESGAEDQSQRSKVVEEEDDNQSVAKS
jgi:hypothetical protein